MNKLVVLFIVLVFSGCASNSHKAELYRQKDAEEKAHAEKLNERFETIKKKMLATSYSPDLLIRVKSMLHLMSAFQEGRVTEKSMKGFSYFLEDPVGRDSGTILSTSFQCLQVIPIDGIKDENGKEIQVYKALYSNPFIPITASVYWHNTRPLVGQKLNTDFLMFLGVGEYENKSGDKRSEVQFILPSWAY
ncbi:MAG: hypothetical protein Q7T36_00725 [Fluviicoccus sp.]|uniref:hypothetical protein n=1 Tax=Fluviicoccus sp. TaxID=2003552 RepID=UPI00271ED0CB|nr:hypothetical protein [Fluviicoccus sp.]MDO8328977.1 hypothetical protein [Fluviicoccus sp.]